MIQGSLGPAMQCRCFRTCCIRQCTRGICKSFKESLGTAGLEVCGPKIRWPGVLSPSQGSGLVAEKGRVEGCTSREDTVLASNDPSCSRVEDPHTERNSKKRAEDSQVPGSQPSWLLLS